MVPSGTASSPSPVIDHDLPIEDLRGAIGHRRLDAGRGDAFHWLAGVAHVVRHDHTIIGHVLGPSHPGQGEHDQTERQERPGEDGERSSMLGQGARSWYEVRSELVGGPEIPPATYP